MELLGLSRCVSRQEDLEKLREAIEAAEVEGVELLEARDVERRLTAKEALLGAKGEEQLRRALEKARGVLEEEDLRPFEESLERFEEQRSFEEAKEKAKELLREAKDVEALRSAIHMAQKAHLDVELDIQRLRDLEAFHVLQNSKKNNFKTLKYLIKHLIKQSFLKDKRFFFCSFLFVFSCEGRGGAGRRGRGGAARLGRGAGVGRRGAASGGCGA